MRVALIGYGSIARDVIASFDTVGSRVEIVAALIRSECAEARDSRIAFCSTVEDIIALKPDVVVECAGQEAVRQFGEDILAAGISLMIVSIGALCDDELRQRLQATARRNACQIHLPAGAVGGIDALGAARLAGIDSVLYRGIKPPHAWKGSAAENTFDLDGLTTATTIFSGNARDAARLFPKNSNVAATIAIAGAGFDQTCCELIADPDASDNKHLISVRSAAASFEITLSGNPSSRNPRTSMLTALGVARGLGNLCASIVI